MDPNRTVPAREITRVEAAGNSWESSPLKSASSSPISPPTAVDARPGHPDVSVFFAVMTETLDGCAGRGNDQGSRFVDRSPCRADHMGIRARMLGIRPQDRGY